MTRSNYVLLKGQVKYILKYSDLVMHGALKPPCLQPEAKGLFAFWARMVLGLKASPAKPTDGHFPAAAHFIDQDTNSATCR